MPNLAAGQSFFGVTKKEQFTAAFFSLLYNALKKSVDAIFGISYRPPRQPNTICYPPYLMRTMRQASADLCDDTDRQVKWQNVAGKFKWMEVLKI